MNYNGILKIIPEYVAGYVQSKANEVKLPYHNMLHTKGVVEATKQIAHHYQLNEHDYFVVVTAAWFHDLGYYSGESKDHEVQSVAIATEFLKCNAVNARVVEEIAACIMATKMPQQPVTLLQKILCDADLYNLGTKEFCERNKLMRKEQELKQRNEIDRKEWRASTIELLQQHHYHTDYCQLLLNETKQKNLEQLLKKNKISKQDNPDESEDDEISAAIKPSNKKNGKGKDSRPVRGIETMIRVASTNHQRLSDMADNKAHIMISVNSIILSIVIGLVARKLDTIANVLFPVLILLVGAVMAIIFSVLATRPKIPSGYFVPEQVQNKTANLLFFGNFYKMKYEEYWEAMKKVMDDGEFLYGSLVRDIFSQGVVLGNKYKLLRLSYTIFMFTLVLSVIGFGITFIFLNK